MGCHPSHWRTHIFSEGWLNQQPEHVKELVLEAILAAIVSLVESWISVGFLKKMISSPWLSWKCWISHEFSKKKCDLPGLVNIQKTMEHHHYWCVNQLFLWVIFNSYVKFPEANGVQWVFNEAFPWEPTNLGILAQICHGTELLCHIGPQSNKKQWFHQEKMMIYIDW